jgi:hypothetical protein
MCANEVAFIGVLIQIGSQLGFVVSLISLIWSGVQRIIANKDIAKQARAKRRIRLSLAGLAVSFLSYLILLHLISFCGFNLLLL